MSVITAKHPLRTWLSQCCELDEFYLWNVSEAYEAYGDYQRAEFKRETGCDWPKDRPRSYWDYPQRMSRNMFSRSVREVCAQQGSPVDVVKASRMYIKGLRPKIIARPSSADTVI